MNDLESLPHFFNPSASLTSSSQIQQNDACQTQISTDMLHSAMWHNISLQNSVFADDAQLTIGQSVVLVDTTTAF
jgi:hypothetical protein